MTDTQRRDIAVTGRSHIERLEAGGNDAGYPASMVGGGVTVNEVAESQPSDRAVIAADAGRLPARRVMTARAAARLERRAVMRLVDDRISFERLGSLTDRARLRDQVMADLATSRVERVAAARSQARTNGRWPS